MGNQPGMPPGPYPGIECPYDPADYPITISDLLPDAERAESDEWSISDLLDGDD